MKKTIKLFAATLTLGTLLVPALASADSVSYDSNGRIIFEASTDPTNPVDPTNPANPVDPIDPINPDGPQKPTAGPLSIDFASSFDFGTQKISSVNQIYFAQAQKYKLQDEGKTEKTGPNYVQVTDNRGTEEGWDLKVTQNSQFKTSEVDGNKELTGAEITLTGGNVVAASKSAKPTGKTDLTLSPGEETRVMDAANGQGAGTYLLAWGSDAETGGRNVKLTVPGSTTKYAKTYTTTLTWTLSSLPAN